MNNFTQRGESLELTAPGGGVVKGTAYLIGSLLVVAEVSADAAAKFSALAKGVVDLPKPADETWTEGVKVYWDDTAKNITTVSGGNTLVGVAVTPQAIAIVLATDALVADVTIEGAVLTVIDYTGLTGKTVTVTIGGTTYTLTEGTDFDAETDNETTASNLATAIAALDLAQASVDTDTAEVTVFAGTGATNQTPAVGRLRLDGGAR